MLLKVGRITLQENFGNWTDSLLAQRGFALAPFEAEMAVEAYHYPYPDPFDGVIVATARVMDLPLITRDKQITDSLLADIFW